MQEERPFLAVGEFVVELDRGWEQILRTRLGKNVLLGIRGENIEVFPTPSEGSLKAQVLVVEPLGAQQLLTVQVGKDLIKVTAPLRFSVQPGQTIGLAFAKDKIRLFDEVTGTALG